MTIHKKRYSFVRQTVAFTLLLVAALVYLAVTLVVVRPSQDVDLAPQSAMVMLPDEAPTTSATMAKAQPASEATAPARDGNRP